MTTPPSFAALVEDRIEAALADAELLSVARGLQATVRIECPPDRFDVAFEPGAAPRRLEPSAAAPDITVSADADSWGRVLGESPRAGFHAFTALQVVNRAFQISGDPLRIAQARPALERLFEGLIGRLATPPAPAAQRDLSQISGRYVTLDAGGDVTLYVEEAGSGPPVLLLHTAGADSRQYQTLLSDVQLAKRWRLIAFDMPFHGRSMPPLDWDGGVYRLEQRRYREIVSRFIETVVGEPVILVGCSMGAAMTLVMAADRPDLLKGAIALEAPLLARGRRNPFLTHAAVAGGSHNSAFVRSLTSPGSPPERRRRAAWIYAQGAPGVHDGDLMFYSDEFDGHEVAARIDAARLPVRLLTGEYDYSATPADGRVLCGLIPGSEFREMPGLGHFPMTENPDLFRPYLVEALESL